MSGLEPIAALSLACSILQVIGVGLETVRVAKQVYCNGALDPALAAKAAVLDDLSGQICATTSSKRAVPPKATARGDKQLFDLADRCMGAARDLREEVSFLNGQSTRTQLVAALKVAARTTWRKRRLENLDRKLREAEGLLQTGLLARIYERTEKTGKGVAALNADLRSFLDEYRKGYADAACLVSSEALRTRAHVSTEAKRSEEALKAHITQKTTQAEASLREHIGMAVSGAARREQDARLEARREQLLRSLKFNRMNERRNQVAASHPKTFEWVLRDGSDVGGADESHGVDSNGASDDPSDDESDTSESGPYSSGGSSGVAGGEDKMPLAGPSWDSFCDWLRSTEPVYWISGKPGSGKTTLIKYLLDHPRTRSFLDLWSPGAVLICHFFWRPGTEMQQSIRGLLCSLLYQLLLGDNASVDRILGASFGVSNKDAETDWSNQELQSTLLDVMCHYPKPMVLFLDGLDEVLPRDGTLRLLDVVDCLLGSQSFVRRVKMCLGARREPLIEGRLQACPQLRLQDLNRADLQRYAEDSIKIPSNYHVTILPGSEMCFCTEDHDPATCRPEKLPSRQQIRNWLVAELVRKAEGVFLWLCITARAITKALNQGETVMDLRQRIENLPRDLADLYADMWNRVNDDGSHLRKRAATYIRLCLTPERMTSFTMMVATNPGMADLIRNCTPPKVGLARKLLEACRATIQDVEIRCGGLLECATLRTHRELSDVLIPWYGNEYLDLALHASDSMSFKLVHRTAYDFLTDPVKGREILDASQLSECMGRLRSIEAWLLACRMFRWPAVVNAGQPDSGICTQSVLESHLFPIGLLLNALPAGEDNGVRAECARLLHFCEQLFDHGYLWPAFPLDNLFFDLAEERPMQYRGIRTGYLETVKRRHEFLVQAALANTHLWSFILEQVETRNLDGETISELLLHVCNIWTKISVWERFDPMEKSTPAYLLTFEDRLRVARSLLHRGADISWTGLRRVRDGTGWWKFLPATPLKCLLSSACDLITYEPRIVGLTTAGHILNFIRLLISHGADPCEEILPLTYRVVDGRLVESHFSQSSAQSGISPGGMEEAQFIVAHPALSVLRNVLQTWNADSPEIQTFPRAWDINTSDMGSGRLVGMVHLGPVYRHLYSMGPEEDMEEELLWVVGAAQRMLRDSPRWAAQARLHEEEAGIPIPAEVLQGLFRAFERRWLENGEVLIGHCLDKMEEYVGTSLL